MSPLHPYKGVWPTIGPNVFVADGAHLIGRVTVAERASVWFNAVLRADIEAISLGARSNVQDNSTLHVDHGFPTVIGQDVTVGHGVTIHGSTIEDRVLVGMGAVILTGCVIGSESIVGAHALITEKKVIPPRSLVLGTPGRVIRTISDDELADILENARHYVGEAATYLGIQSPVPDGEG